MKESFQDIVIPPELAHRLQQVFHLGAVPRLLGDLTLSGSVNLGPFTDGIAARLVSAIPTRHRARIGGESLYTHCVMDAFMLPVLRNEPVEIDSLDPETGERVRVHVTPEGYLENHTTLSEVIVSFGVAREDDGSVYSAVCPFINLFSSRINYEGWRQAHPEAVTMAIPLVDAVALARAWTKAGSKCC
jgi:Alkylmercury lyase